MYCLLECMVVSMEVYAKGEIKLFLALFQDQKFLGRKEGFFFFIFMNVC